jgi:NAD(P)-dependent dehydrogenase (short-subunit alcohol dehydrogenase family)
MAQKTVIVTGGSQGIGLAIARTPRRGLGPRLRAHRNRRPGVNLGGAKKMIYTD